MNKSFRGPQATKALLDVQQGNGEKGIWTKGDVFFKELIEYGESQREERREELQFF